MAEQAYAYVTLIPVAKGFQSAVASELSGVGGETGATVGSNFRSGFMNTVKGFAGPLLTGLLAVKGIEFAKGAIAEASDLNEAGTAIDVTFGKASDVLKNYASTAASTMGQSKNQFLDAAKTFGIFGKAAGLTETKNVEFSNSLVGLASDMASFNNTTVDEAINALGAGLRGESEPLRRYGVLLSDAALKARATEMGIYKGNGALTAQQKVLAAQAEIMAQTSLQQGDFARTSDGLANSQRILSANMQNMSATVGMALLPAMASLTQAMVPVVEELAPVLADTFAALAPVLANLAGVLPGLLTAFIPLFPVLTQLITIFADLAVALLPSLISIINMLMPVVTALVPPILELVKALLPIIPAILQIVLAFMPLITAVLPIVTGLIEKLIPVIEFIADLLANVLSVAIGIMVAAFELVSPVIKVVGDVFEEVFSGVESFFKGVINNMAGWFEGFLNFFIDGINTVIGGINDLADADPTGLVPNISKIPKASLPRFMADGGLVMGPTNAIVGEAGPEVVIPLNRFENMMGLDSGNGGGKTLNYYAAPNISVDSEQQLFQAMKRAKVVANW